MENRVALRPLLPQDEPFLWEMLYLAIYIPESQSPLPRTIVQAPKLAHYVRDWGQVPGDLGFAAVDQATGQPVGAAWLRLLPAEDPGYGFIDEETPELTIAILPEYRGQGVGSRLLTALVQAAQERYVAVSLSVSRENPALRLYERLGFVVVGEDESSWIMRRRL